MIKRITTMLANRMKKLPAFLCGAICMALILGVATPAIAAMTGKDITVYTGIKVFVNDQLIEPTDVNGNPVEVFIYNGTTYLPIRAIGNALGLPVAYDGAAYSAYVGKHSSSTPSVWLADMDYFSGFSSIPTATSEQDNTGATHYHCITGYSQRTYLLNGQYTSMSGVLYQAYKDRSSSTYTNNNYLEIYGDGELLYSASYAPGVTGIVPTDFYVDLTGVLQLQVKFDSDGDMLSIGDVGLYT